MSEKNEVKPWLKEQWCIPPKRDAEFVVAIEDVPDVYHRPYAAKRPLVALDEASKQLVGEVVVPIPAAAGQPERFDYEYVRNGTANLVMVSAPLVGWRAVRVTERRTAKGLRWLVEEVHPDADTVVLVLDNVNTHKVASLYQAFPPERARRIAERLEIHYTPKHGSWLNVAEIELSVLTRQCLDRRIGPLANCGRRWPLGRPRGTNGPSRRGGDLLPPVPHPIFWTQDKVKRPLA